VGCTCELRKTQPTTASSKGHSATNCQLAASATGQTKETHQGGVSSY
jgi:hypothetical protein